MAESYEGNSGLAVLKLLNATGLVDKRRASSLELRAAVRRGLPFHTFEALLKAVALPRKQLAVVLGIPDRTLARRKEAKHLTAAESDRLYRVARTIAHTASVLGSIEKARAWITRPNRALGDEPPLTLLDTDIGARQVEDVLLRIEYGIPS
jgi:putative toxin-antitoxin system antitoxin component (TIGR02293 family)